MLEVVQHETPGLILQVKLLSIHVCCVWKADNGTCRILPILSLVTVRVHPGLC